MTSTVNVPSESNHSSEDIFCFPTSFAQQRLWFLNQLVPENSFYNVTAAVRLAGTLNLDSLEQTFNEIVRRHEALRTTIARMNGELVQVIDPHVRVLLPIIKLHAVPAAQRDEVAQQRAIIEFQRPFDLTIAPLIRVTLIQFDETDHVLLLNLHHIVADGWSIGVLIQELGALYTAFLTKMPSLLPELPIQYADFTQWQRNYLQGGVLESQLAYWRQQLMDLPLLNLPTDRPRPAVQSYRGARQHLALTPALTKALETLSQHGITLFMTLLSAFQILLYRYTGQKDIAVGSPIANRNLSEIEGLIGFFVNSLVLRSNLVGTLTFRELLQQVQATTLAAYAHQDLPFEKLVEELQPERDLSRNPLFQVVFALQNTPIAALQLPSLTLNPIEIDPGTTRFDLEFHCFKSLDTLHCTVIYSTDLFDPSTINRMLQHFRVLLEGIVASSDQTIAHLPLLTAEETHQLLVECNNTAINVTQDCIHQIIEAQAEQTPDAVAVVFTNQLLTYRELNQRANQLAYRLQQLGVEPESLVGLCVDRSLDLIIGILGIWKVGAAYLPLDPSYPSARLNFILKDAQVSVLVTQPTYCDQFVDRVQIVCLNQDWTNQANLSNPTNNVTANNLAYVIYTSGSTGKPKGVLVEHRGLINLAMAQQQIFNLQPTSRILQFAALSFDASIFELVMALTTGAALYLAPKETLLPGATLLQFLRDNAITHVTLPPAVLAMLSSEALPVQTIISAGDACSSTVVDHWAKNHQFFNAYGPTETTIWTTVARLQSGEQPTIGRAIANTQIYLLDAHLQLVPVGVTGEVYIGGDGLARGYLNRPELTAERFMTNPFNPASRLYRTGDLARYRADGNLDYLGRVDRQVKLRGYRIEPGEIESVLHQHPGIQTAVVTVREDSSRVRLVAYVLLNLKQLVTTDDLYQFLRSQLPDYLVPSAFVRLETLPLMSNGKIDYGALPDPSQNNLEQKSFVAPRTAIEATLVSIWRQLLQREQIGIYDSFFDLGGHSLLAIRLLDLIQQQFEREISLSSLFLNPTIAELAIALNFNSPLNWSPLVPLQPKGSKPPFFCVHPIFGVVLPYHELAKQMGLDQPFYGLQPFGIDGKTPHTCIEEMADYYIKAIRQVQPQGPYFLGGWSFGGLVAFEMAQQLRRAGQQIALLAILDTLAPIPSNKPSFWKGFKFLLSTATQSVGAFLLDYIPLIATSYQLNPIVRTKLPQTWQALLERAAISTLLPQESQMRVLDELTIRPMLRVFYANSQAVHRYVPQTYPDFITLFRTSALSPKAAPESTLGWHHLTEAQIDIHQIPGNHFTMLRNPDVEVLAKQLLACIENSRPVVI